ncbi:hypothetical protein ACQ4PT_016485 [Festuca glaucescens]
MPASSTSASCSLKAKPSCWRSMAMSLGSLLRRLRGAPQSPTVARYNPESTGVGILSAVNDTRQCVLGPLIHSGARDILEVALPSVCCQSGHGRPFRAAILSCALCSSWIGHGAVYMYKGEIGFCKPECRDDYILEELHRDQRRQERAGGSPAPRGVRSRGRDGDTSSIFFTCADDIL